MLRQLHADLWECNQPMAVLGMHLGHRMTVVRLPDGSLWVHSPVRFSESLARELAGIGPIGHVVAPNYMHDTYLDGWLRRYPDVRFHAPRSFHKVLPHFPLTDVLGATAHSAWADVLEQHVVQGVPRLHEVVFFHRASRTLIVADLAFNLGAEMPLLSRTLLRLNGCYCRFTPSRMFKAVIRDRAALGGSIDRILEWEFDRIIVSHGDNIERDGRTALREAFAFL